MCGRYSLATPDPSQIRARFPIGERLEIRRRYNVAPGDDVLAVVQRATEPEGAVLRWGLVPHWAKDPRELGVKTINARAETIDERPAYRDAFGRKRCLILADGFYEWSSGTPHWITRADGELFAFAGLWASWRPENPRGPASAGHVAGSGTPDEPVEPLRSCTIVTTAATEAIRDLHDRMPVILPPDAERAWLDPGSPSEQLHGLLASAPVTDLVARPVSRAVNDARHDEPDCLDPPEQTALF
jgi:putative SOS response-associated peptidase YedK